MAVGEEIVYHCPKCFLHLGHVIESEYNGKILKVMCKTCKKSHKYIKKDEKKTESKRAKALKSITKENPGLPPMQPAGVRKYSMKEKYKTGETIFHEKYGVGNVVTALQDKVEIQFEDDPRSTKFFVHCR